MKIVIYFSVLFGLFWLIHGVLSHDPVTRRKSIKHANQRGEHSSKEPQSEEVLIRSESPLRGRKIHQTAWSKEEETDGENGQVTKQHQESTGLENSWTLEKILKYLTSLVHPTEGADQHPGHILITPELLRDGSEAKSKNKQKPMKKKHDEVPKQTQNNDKGKHVTQKLSYLEDYYENLQTEISDDSDESYEFSYEYENEDESRINYRRNSKILWNDKPIQRFPDKNRKTSPKADKHSSLEDDEDCSEDTEVNLKQSYGEIDVFQKKIVSKNNNMEQSSEESNFKQKTISNKKYKGIKNILRSKIEQGRLLPKKHVPKIIVLNGTKFTGQNNKNKENDNSVQAKKHGHQIIVLNGTEVTGQNNKNEDSMQTSIQRNKSKVKLSNTENTVNENISETTTIDEQQKIQTDSYVNQEMIQQTNNKISQNTSVSQTEKDVITDKTELGKLNKSDNIEENTKTSFITESKTDREMENKNSFIETKQSTSSADKNIKNEILKTENVQNEKTLITTSIDNTTKQSLDEKNINSQVIHPEVLTFKTKQENTQTIIEETANNPVQAQTVLINTELKNDEMKQFEIQNQTEKLSDTQLVGVNNRETMKISDKSSQQEASQIFIIENNQQHYEAKNLNDQIKETRLISKDDNGYEYVLEGNEFVPLNSNNEGKSNDKTVKNYASENKSQLLTESIVEILQDVNQADNKHQETFETILEFLYKYSKNPFILSLKENSSVTTH